MGEWQFTLLAVGVGTTVGLLFAIGKSLEKIARTLDDMLHEMRTRGKNDHMAGAR
jgi:hypothetical protein